MKRTKKYRLRERTSLFSLFLLISLLLHLLVGLVFQHRKAATIPEDRVEQTPVALQERKNWLELDQRPLDKPADTPQNTTHIAETNAKVKVEAAPKGDDSRDQKRAEQLKQQIVQQPPPPQKPVISPALPLPSALPLQTEERGEQSPSNTAKQEVQPNQVPISLPNIKSLTNLSPTTLARLDRQQQKERRKDRPEIELKADEVWLNLRQDDKLISFFRRFSDRIEAVWNYPVEASSRGVEGTLLIKIIVNKKGELLDAFPLESSGSEILDYEAITAIYRAAPFGELPSYYQHEQLKIYAHFQYNLSRRMIYGNP